MAFELTPAQHDLGKFLLHKSTPIGCSTELDELLLCSGYERPMSLETIDRLAWSIGYTFADKAPQRTKVMSLSLGERFAVRSIRNLGWLSVEAADLVTAKNSAEFLDRTSIIGKFESWQLEILIGKSIQIDVKHELRDILGQEE
jgi:hypothetical protein